MGFWKTNEVYGSKKVGIINYIYMYTSIHTYMCTYIYGKRSNKMRNGHWISTMTVIGDLDKSIFGGVVKRGWGATSVQQYRSFF